MLPHFFSILFDQIVYEFKINSRLILNTITQLSLQHLKNYVKQLSKTPKSRKYKIAAMDACKVDI